MERVFLGCGAVAGFLGVVAGAFGAHFLKDRLSAELLNIFETGVRYQMYHALALLFVAWAYTRWPGTFVHLSGWFFIVGIIIFSGSLYLLAFTNLRWFGALTPFGGVAFLIGWLVLIWFTIKSRIG